MVFRALSVVQIFLSSPKKKFVSLVNYISIKVDVFRTQRDTAMQSYNIRLSDKPFIDRVKFPYGFRKAGDFSIAEADLLTKYGKTLLNLESGTDSPQSSDEQHFVEFVAGKVPASNSLEKVWQKYVHLARGKRHFYTLHSTASNQSDFDEDYTDESFDVA